MAPDPLLFDGTALELAVVDADFTLTANASAPPAGSTFWSLLELFVFVVAACRGSTTCVAALVVVLDGGLAVAGGVVASEAGLTLFKETKGVAPGVLWRVVAPGETDRVLEVVVGGASFVVVAVVVVVVAAAGAAGVCSVEEAIAAGAAAGLESGMTEGTSNSGGRV